MVKISVRLMHRDITLLCSLTLPHSSFRGAGGRYDPCTRFPVIPRAPPPPRRASLLQGLPRPTSKRGIPQCHTEFPNSIPSLYPRRTVDPPFPVDVGHQPELEDLLPAESKGDVGARTRPRLGAGRRCAVLRRAIPCTYRRSRPYGGKGW